MNGVKSPKIVVVALGRLIEAGISPTSLTNLATIDIKKDEPVVDLLTHSLRLSKT